MAIKTIKANRKKPKTKIRMRTKVMEMGTVKATRSLQIVRQAIPNPETAMGINSVMGTDHSITLEKGTNLVYTKSMVN
ncbi:hypothetical protein ACFOZY_09365 [Chungangia koreensis]|uniref:Uncharacterized protein n=1 Tax=Chungangia koreensis TaxID=752657 RepID=A0ABV8X6P0_9LACT